jgi:hypothetical protein
MFPAMPALKNPRHEKFCTLYPHAAANGRTQGDIYLAAGFTASTVHSAEVMASRLLKRPDILARLAEIGLPATKKAKIDTDDYLAKFERIYEGASIDKQFGPATRAAELQARMTGHLVDKSEIRATIEIGELNSVEDVARALLTDTKPAEALAMLDILRAEIERAAAGLADVVNVPIAPIARDETALSLAALRPRPKNGRETY